jgi:hypothetical protein
MSTERQQNASRINGSKSHGPVTSEGKLASSRNAITHGMLSSTIVLKGESTDRFLWLLTSLLEEFQPQTPFEESLIENMAVARWRQMRIWGMEKASMDHEMRRQPATLSNSADVDPSEQAATRAHRRFLEVRDRRTPPPPPAPVPEKVDSSKGTPEVIANKVTPINASDRPAAPEPIAARISRALFAFIRVPIPGGSIVSNVDG